VSELDRRLAKMSVGRRVKIGILHMNVSYKLSRKMDRAL